MLLVIDNFDSFTFNIVHYLHECGANVQVVRNNAISIAEVHALNPHGIVISPGPGTPDEAGISLDLIKAFSATHPILGICLGHQALAQAFGGRIIRAPYVMHGKTSLITHEQTDLFKSLPSEFEVTRYHSLVVDPDSLPPCFKVTARSREDNVIMALAHRELPLFGVQFHPEAILTEYGHALLNEFVVLAKRDT